MMVVKKRKVVLRPNKNVTASTKYIKAAFDDEEDGMEDTDGIMDSIDDVADTVEDLQDTIDDVEEDSVDIAINNNIADHFIAECEGCGGVFISAVVDSDQILDSVSGICPLCGRETEQYLKWVIRDVNAEESEEV